MCTPIDFLVALYSMFCYPVLCSQVWKFLCICGERYGWGPLLAELPFLRILLGAVVGCAFNMYNEILYNRAYGATGNSAVP